MPWAFDPISQRFSGRQLALCFLYAPQTPHPRSLEQTLRLLRHSKQVITKLYYSYICNHTIAYHPLVKEFN